MRVVIDPGMLPSQDVVRIVAEAGGWGRVSIVYEDKRPRSDWRTLTVQPDVHTYQQLARTMPKRVPDGLRETHERGFDTLVRDPRTNMILERNTSDPMKPWSRRRSAFLGLIDMEVAYSAFLLWLHEVDPSFVLFQATPHNVFTWAMASAARALGIPVRYFETSPLPWRYWVVEGLEEPRLVFPTEVQPVLDSDHRAVDRYLQQNTRSYDGAIPVYEKERLGSYGLQAWFWRRELKRSVRLPSLLVQKRAAFRTYARLAYRSAPRGAKTVVFFLHFQPERTSIPEAGIFAQQWLAVRALRDGLPADWVVIVKEHPSMYTATFDPRFRDAGFYEKMAALPNVVLAPLFDDPFELIDRAEAIATLSGTVGVQALCRGVPVLHFGAAAYGDAPAAHRVRCVADVERVMSAYRDNSEGPNERAIAVRSYLVDVTARSVAGDVRGDDMTTTAQFHARRVAGHLTLLHELLAAELRSSQEL